MGLYNQYTERELLIEIIDILRSIDSKLSSADNVDYPIPKEPIKLFGCLDCSEKFYAYDDAGRHIMERHEEATKPVPLGQGFE